jgi:hypothetical protein
VSSPWFFVVDVELELVLLAAANLSRLLSFKSTNSAKSGTGAAIFKIFKIIHLKCKNFYFES